MASFKTIYKREATEGIARLKPVPDLTEKDIASLPDPVQQYLRYTGALGKPQVQICTQYCPGSLNCKRMAGC